MVFTLTLGTRYRDPFGQLKWTDFVHFYTLGHIARHGPPSDLYDAQAQHRRQVALLPESAPERYLPVYPPQTALLFAPFSSLPYHFAAASWALIGIAVYAWSVRVAWRSVEPALTNSSLVAICAAAFPPICMLVLHGQTTAVPIAAFTCATLALARGRSFLAGLALGLLFIKPQFGLMLAVVVVACRQASILAGLVVSACIQSIAVVMWLGYGVLLQYVQLVPRIPALQSALEPKVALMHSLAVVTGLLPDGLSAGAWLLATAVVSWMTVHVWRSPGVPPSVRMAALVLGSVLVSPHLNIYDAAVLAGPLVSLSGWIATQSGSTPAIRQRWNLAIYALFLFLFFPTARIIRLQLSPLVMMVLLYFVYRVAAHSTPRSAADD